MQRQDSMRLLALAPEALLEKAYNRLKEHYDFTREYILLRHAEAGLIMVRGRISNSGSPFNVGEALVTRCAVQSAQGHIGHAWVLGEKARHAELAAALDAFSQDERLEQVFSEDILPQIAASLTEARKQSAQKAEKTRVNFFTLVRGED